MKRSAKVVQMIKEHPERFDTMDCRPVKPMTQATLENFASARLRDRIQQREQVKR